MPRKKKDTELEKVIKALKELKEGRVVITVSGSRIAQVEYLDKDWSRDIWGLGGEGI
jgi:hypothetical protein